MRACLVYEVDKYDSRLNEMVNNPPPTHTHTHTHMTDRALFTRASHAVARTGLLFFIFSQRDAPSIGAVECDTHMRLNVTLTRG